MKLCWDFVRVPLLRSLGYRHPPYHLKLPRFLTGTVWFKSTHNLSHLSFCPTAKISSTCTTAVIATRSWSSTKRKTHTSVMYCSKPSLLRHFVRWACHVRDACFNPYKLLLSRTTFPERSPHPFGNRRKTFSSRSDWTKAWSTSKWQRSKSHWHAIALKRRTQELDTVGANVSLKYTPSRCLKPPATNLDSAFTTHPCSSTFHVYTHLASITFATDC